MLRLAMATSKVSGTSVTGAAASALSSQRRGSGSSAIRPRSASIMASHTLIGESRSVSAGEASRARTARESRAGSSSAQSQICVSSSTA